MRPGLAHLNKRENGKKIKKEMRLIKMTTHNLSNFIPLKIDATSSITSKMEKQPMIIESRHILWRKKRPL